MATIYGLFTDQFCWYVGSTTNLKIREQAHRRKESKGFGADLIASEYAWDCRKLEDCVVNIRWAREKHWCETLHPLLNQRVPGRSNREAHVAWYAANREKINERKRQRRAARKSLYVVDGTPAPNSGNTQPPVSPRYLQYSPESYQKPSGQRVFYKDYPGCLCQDGA